MTKNNINKTKKESWFLIFIIAVAIISVALYSIFILTPQEKLKHGQLAKAPFERADKIEAVKEIGGDFNLVDMHGKNVSLKDFKNKNLMIYFGFTHCPDICPTTLTVMSNVMEELTDVEKSKIQPIFVSVDPKRDTPEKLKKYLEGNFHPSIVALTGSDEQIQDITKKYKIFFETIKDESGGSNYLINHTSLVYLTNPSGHYLTNFSLESQVPEIVVKIREFLN